MDEEARAQIIRDHAHLIPHAYATQSRTASSIFFNDSVPHSESDEDGHLEDEDGGEPSGASNLSCGSSVVLSDESGPLSPASGRIINFGDVAQGVFRSSFPRDRNLAHLKSLMLKTIITLVDTEFEAGLLEYMAEFDVTHHRILIPAHRDGNVIPFQSIVRVMRILLNETNEPILVHCNKGKHRTGCMIACFRKIQAFASATQLLPVATRPEVWTVAQVVEEYRRYAGDKAREEDIKFIDDFDAKACIDALSTVTPSSHSIAIPAPACHLYRLQLPLPKPTYPYFPPHSIPWSPILRPAPVYGPHHSWSPSLPSTSPYPTNGRPCLSYSVLCPRETSPTGTVRYQVIDNRPASYPRLDEFHSRARH